MHVCMHKYMQESTAVVQDNKLNKDVKTLILLIFMFERTSVTKDESKKIDRNGKIKNAEEIRCHNMMNFRQL